MTTDRTSVAEREASAVAALANAVAEAAQDRAALRAEFTTAFDRSSDTSVVVRALGLPGLSRLIVVPLWGIFACQVLLVIERAIFR